MNAAGDVSPHPTAPRRRLVGLAGTAIALLAGLVAIPQQADAAVTRAPGNHVTHPQLDWMGSTVPAHEKHGAGVAVELTPLFVSRTLGMDVSSHQGNVNWRAAWSHGGKFAYVKATESTTYKNPYFAQQYTGSYKAGMIRGAYHFATPNTSSGTAQADYFVARGGGWSRDGTTLPPALDIEYNPYGSTCYGKSKAAMTSWIAAFVNEVHARTTRWPAIYTTTDWWTTCTGNTHAFSSKDPLFIARYASTVGTLPGGWAFYTFWQHASSGAFPGDQDYFNGPYTRLQNLARNT